MTATLECKTCLAGAKKHSYQDLIYGLYVRVMNVSESGTSCKCTVCGTKQGTTKQK